MKADDDDDDDDDQSAHTSLIFKEERKRKLKSYVSVINTNVWYDKLVIAEATKSKIN